MMVVLIAFGGLSLDLGRVFVLRTEMQNAADSAALAAARELDGMSGAQARAEAAARNALEYAGRFAADQELLKANISPPEFFCSIGSGFDPDSDVIDNFCLGAPEPPGDPNRRLATGDSDSHYVKVSLVPADDGSTYTLPLLFLPVLNLFTNNVDSTASLNASATAGRHFFQCNFPPAMICNPFEGSGGNFETSMIEGGQVLLRDSNDWESGNFAFLRIGEASGTGPAAGYLADPNTVGCQAPILSTETGQMANSTTFAINTRFDMYGPPAPAPFNQATAPGLFPPAPNVINYPNDQTFQPSPADRFGTGDWNRNQYFIDYHDWQWGLGGRPGNWANLTRWAVYNWELNESKLPSLFPLVPGANEGPDYDGIPDPNHENTGSYPPPQSIPERRVIDVGVVNCGAQGITGQSTFSLFGDEGFAKLFLTRQADGTGSPKTIFAEYIGWASDESESNYHIDVQLFE